MSRSRPASFEVTSFRGNTKIFKRPVTHFRSSSRRRRDINVFFQICYLANIGQCYQVQHSQRRISVAMASFCKSHSTHFNAIALTVSDILMFGMKTENLGHGHEVQHSHWPRSMANMKACKIGHFR